MNNFYRGGRGLVFFRYLFRLFKSRNNRSRTLFSVAISICLFNLSTALAQSAESRTAEGQKAIRPIRIGENIPEALWYLPLQVVNHSESKDTITLHDYRDKKLIILDFWATYCSPCIKSLVKLDSIQQLFPQDMAVLPILVYDRAENVPPFMEKRGWAWPSVVNDTLWNKTVLSRYLTGFGNAWIMDGKLMAVPRPDNLTYENIRSALQGEFPDLQNLEQVSRYETDKAAADTSTVGTGPGHKAHTLEEVIVSTGYYQTPKERATGSFSHLDEQLLNWNCNSKSETF